MMGIDDCAQAQLRRIEGFAQLTPGVLINAGIYRNCAAVARGDHAQVIRAWQVQRAVGDLLKCHFYVPSL